MTDRGIASGEQFLISSAQGFFASLLQSSDFKIGVEIDKDLRWTPSFHFRILDHLIIACEVSETPYPAIFRMRRTNIMGLQVPIAVYCVCPEEAYLQSQADAKDLMNDGYGLLTVAADGSVQRRSGCIPVIQQIAKGEFDHDVRKLPKSLRTRLAECFDNYNHSAPSGVSSITEIMEGLILRAGRDAAKKQWISSAEVRPGQTVRILTALRASPQTNGAAAALAAAQAYISIYRNLSHHFPKDKKQAAAKYRDCRHAFLDGLKKIGLFRDGLKKIGLSGAV